MIGIIGAMEVEIERIKALTSNLVLVDKGIRQFYTGQIKNKDLVIVQAGIGKVNAAVTTSILIEQFHPDYIINIGVAGGQNGVSHKDVVVSDECVYHDFDVTAFSNYVRGQVPGEKNTFHADKELLDKTVSILKELKIPFHIGMIASGDQFVTKKESIKEINREYKNIYAIEMEASAIAHVATMYAVPFIVYRSISDVLDDEGQENDYESFLEEASVNASLVLEELIGVL